MGNYFYCNNYTDFLKGIEKALTTKLSDAREALVNKCIDILAIYRQELAATSPLGQLILPETLKVLPLYILGLVKNILFRSGTDIRPDERSYYFMLARMLPVSLLLNFIYPKLMALHTIAPEVLYLAIEIF